MTVVVSRTWPAMLLLGLQVLYQGVPGLMVKFNSFAWPTSLVSPGPQTYMPSVNLQDLNQSLLQIFPCPRIFTLVILVVLAMIMPPWELQGTVAEFGA